MGVEYYTARFLLQARAERRVFGRTLTIGRQNFFVNRPRLEQLAREFGFNTLEFLKSASPADLVYIEPFFKHLLQATEIESLDVSNYEGATHVHDMNQPIPEALKNSFDTVFEAGSLEHIFNLPVAIKNLMDALRPGGTLFIQTPANNYFGHGFYQFSPELFYRVLSPANGFKIERMHVFEHFFPAHSFSTSLFAVSDPEKIRKRVQLVNKRPTLLLIEARKIENCPIFATTPQQSDYLPLWEKQSTPAGVPAIAQPTCLRDSFKERLYALPLRWVGWLSLQYLANRGGKPSLKNPEFFKELD
jgi:SAM-dependent methyltransferase